MVSVRALWKGAGHITLRGTSHVAESRYVAPFCPFHVLGEIFVMVRLCH